MVKHVYNKVSGMVYFYKSGLCYKNDLSDQSSLQHVIESQGKKIN